MIKEIRSILFIVIYSLATLILLTTLVKSETIGDLEVLNRSDKSNNYKNITSNQTFVEVYLIDINMKNLSGAYRPYSEVTNFSKNDLNLTLNWNNQSVLFRFYTRNQSGYKEYFTKERSQDLSFSTLIELGKGLYHYTHNMTSNLSLQPYIFGYELITNNVSCTKRNKELICGEQKIDFSDAINLQNLTVNITNTSVEFNGSDLAYIDPQVTLSGSDIWNSFGVYDDFDCTSSYAWEQENGGTDEIR